MAEAMMGRHGRECAFACVSVIVTQGLLFMSVFLRDYVVRNALKYVKWVFPGL